MESRLLHDLGEPHDTGFLDRVSARPYQAQQEPITLAFHPQELPGDEVEAVGMMLLRDYASFYRMTGREDLQGVLGKSLLGEAAEARADH
jgi:hypothetical protein